jgi:4-amino-4-deoxy-L-arabinose transferase-like glycosyltransferase
MIDAPRLLRWPARHPFPVLALLGLLLWLPGILSLPPLDRDESRFAQASRQMVETGNLVDIRFGDVARYKKPVGIYWLQAGATRIADSFPGVSDHQIWTYRLPSLLGAIIAAWATTWCALALAGAEAALLAGLLMMGTVLLTGEATIATTDAVLLATIVLMQGVWLRVWRRARVADAPPVSTPLVLVGWAALAAGILVKGPVAPVVALLSVAGLFLWDRQWQGGRWRWMGTLKPLRGIGLAILIVAPWVVAIAIQSHGAFFQQSLGHDLAGKLAGGQESHGAWPGYFLALSAITFWPTILFVAPGLVAGFARRAEPMIRFLLVWALSWWLLVEIVPTKLPHYVLPAYPPLAILAALWLVDTPRSIRGIRVARWVGAIQFVIGAGLLAAAPVFLLRTYGTGPDWSALVLAGVGAVLAALALALYVRHKTGLAMAAGLVALFVFVPTLTADVGPGLTQIWVSKRLAPLVAAHTRPGDPPPVVAGFQEPSLVFALGKDVVLRDGRGAAEVAARTGGLALIEDRAKGAFLAGLAELQDDAKPEATLSGFNYSRGRRVHITLYRVGRMGTGPSPLP